MIEGWMDGWMSDEGDDVEYNCRSYENSCRGKDIRIIFGNPRIEFQSFLLMQVKLLGCRISVHNNHKHQIHPNASLGLI